MNNVATTSAHSNLVIRNGAWPGLRLAQLTSNGTAWIPCRDTAYRVLADLLQNLLIIRCNLRRTQKIHGDRSSEQFIDSKKRSKEKSHLPLHVVRKFVPKHCCNSTNSSEFYCVDDTMTSLPNSAGILFLNLYFIFFS